MTEAVICVHGMLSVMDARGVEKRLLRHPGIRHVEANYLNCTATVHYQEAAIRLAEIKELVEACGYRCTGASLPEHVCKPEAPAPTDRTGDATHPGHAASATGRDDHGASVSPTTEEHIEHATGEETAAMAHEMGHDTGMGMEAMVRDMRQRFVVAAVLTIPVFLYSPLFYRLFGFDLPTPPGVRPDLIAFLLATPVVLYGGWAFYVGAYRALNNGVLNMAVLVSIAVLAGYLIAAGLLYPLWQVTLRPEIGAIAMSGSSIIVAVNALLLKRLELRTG